MAYDRTSFRIPANPNTKPEVVTSDWNEVVTSGGVVYHAGSNLFCESRGPGILAEVSRVLAAASRGDSSAGCHRQALGLRKHVELQSGFRLLFASF